MVNAIGMLAHSTGQRPSTFFEWNDPWEWEARMVFDMMIMGPAMEKMNRGVK